ncbi:hypothetical protein RUM44_010155 [Polyplax serrata]|uniref:Uncharacterized protein n=1 Tax=Polyplax serrata TaxID=468196 RepID=A0ABR1AUS3_POLSC
MKMADTLDGMQKKNIRKVAEAHVRVLFSRGKVSRSERDWEECRGKIQEKVRYPEESLWLSEPSPEQDNTFDFDGSRRHHSSKRIRYEFR